MSCLFNSLGRLLKVDSTQLRNQICDYIINNPDAEWDGTKISDWISMVAGDQFQDIDQYIRQMRNLNKWGGAPEIAICCMIYNISVEVLNYRDRTQNIIFKDHSLDRNYILRNENIQTLISNEWEKYKNKLLLENPLIRKMGRFPEFHPLKQNYNIYINDKKTQFFAEKNKEIQQVQQRTIPTLGISWTGGHYEPVHIKNPRPM